MLKIGKIKFKQNQSGNGKAILLTDPVSNQTFVSCECCCPLEIRSVTASLPFIGYVEFDQGSEPIERRYLKYREIGDAVTGGSCALYPEKQSISQEWTIDPFTGLVCYNGPKTNNFSRVCSVPQNSTSTQINYSCNYAVNDPCSPYQGGAINWNKQVLSQYTMNNVASNVDAMLDRIDPYSVNGMPAGTRADVVNDTNGSILSFTNECAKKRAEYISGEGGVTKTKLFVKFTKKTKYILIHSNGEKNLAFAEKDQFLIIDPPTEKNTWVDLIIMRKSGISCCTSEIVEIAHSGQTINSTFIPNEVLSGTPFIGPDCIAYKTKRTIWSLNRESSLSNNSSGDSNDNRGDYTYTINETGQASVSLTITTTQNTGQSPTSTGSRSHISSYNYSEIREYESGLVIENATTCSSNNSGSHVNDKLLGTYSYKETFDGEVVFEDSNEYEGIGNCFDISHPNQGQESCITVSGSSLTQTFSSSLPGSTQNITETTLFLNPISEISGTWEDEEPEPNETLCALLTENQATKTSSDVDADVHLKVTTPATETAVTYEHWFHYHTIELDNSEEGCPTSNVVAHNEKWTSVSNGGVLTLSRNINLSTPAKDHSICAYGITFVTRVAS